MKRAKEFWDNILRKNGCWIWAGWTRGKYGCVRVSGHKEYAHRVAYRLAIGEIPAGLCVLHRCDNPLCMNPAHLFLGTKADNDRDRDSKGRTARGERSGSAILTASIVTELREAYRTSRFGTRTLARLYGVSRSAVEKAVTGETWGWLS